MYTSRPAVFCFRLQYDAMISCRMMRCACVVAAVGGVEMSRTSDILVPICDRGCGKRVIRLVCLIILLQYIFLSYFHRCIACRNVSDTGVPSTYQINFRGDFGSERTSGQ